VVHICVCLNWMVASLILLALVCFALFALFILLCFALFACFRCVCVTLSSRPPSPSHGGVALRSPPCGACPGLGLPFACFRWITLACQWDVCTSKSRVGPVILPYATPEYVYILHAGTLSVNGLQQLHDLVIRVSGPVCINNRYTHSDSVPSLLSLVAPQA